jgi:hypothetical protein
MLKTSLIIFSISLCFGFRGIPDTENVSSLIEGEELKSLGQIEKKNLNQGSSSLDLWSGSYWPHFQGSLGIRYRDVKFQTLVEKKEQWGEFKDLFEKYPYYLYLRKINDLSPAEKYDLLVGDTNMTLTKYSWDLGEKANILGKVPIWRGICDGWAAASQMMPRPVKSVELKSPQGFKITFYPEDIKALGSLLYARAQNEVIFLGKRCRSRALGLFTNACDETNPGTFHLALVNRVGLMKKTFIADVSPGSEVWNYPVKSYELKFFNVFTGDEFKNFKDALEVFTKTHRFEDSYKRHKKTSYILGVKATVQYADMRPPHLHERDSREHDKILEKEYLYDLELDSRFNILGGMSLTKNLPDFIWAPNDKTYPLSIAEEKGLPSSEQDISLMAKISSKEGQPLSIIVEQLFESAKE